MRLSAVVLLAALGLVIGAFLNSVIDRGPSEGPLFGRGRVCPSCKAELGWRDSLPVRSWVRPCPSCGVRRPSRPALVEIVAAAAAVVVTAWAGLTAALPAFLFLAAVGIVLAAIDYEHRRLPDRIVLPSYLIAAGLLGIAAIADGAWGQYGRALLGGLAMFAVYFLLGLINPDGMGGGDIKLAGVLGMYLGWVGWGALVVGTLAGFLLGAFQGILLIVTRLGGLKSSIPFGPFMIVGAFVGLFWGPQLADWYMTRLSG